MPKATLSRLRPLTLAALATLVLATLMPTSPVIAAGGWTPPT